MENISSYNISEFFALLFSVLIGSGAYISFVYIKNKVKVSLWYVVAVVLINLCLTYIASGFLKVLDWGKWSAPALTMVAFAGQYIADWIDKRYLKIFDSASKKAGFNLNNDKDENNNTSIIVKTKCPNFQNKMSKKNRSQAAFFIILNH